jgi:phytoene/squalene synthetase
MAFQILRTRRLLFSGAALGATLPGRIGLEMRMIIAGGDTILHKLLKADCDMFRRRPVLKPTDWLTMLLHSLLGSRRRAA